MNGTGKCSVLLDELDEHFISKVLKNQKFSKIEIELIKVVTFCFIWIRVTLTDYDVFRKSNWKAFKANIRCLVITVEIVLAAAAEIKDAKSTIWSEKMESNYDSLGQSQVWGSVTLENHCTKLIFHNDESTPKNINFRNYCMFL